MASYIISNVKCASCGNVHKMKLLKGLYQGTPAGLDTKPYEIAAYDRVVKCPECGYCSDDISAPVSEQVKRIIFSDKYKVFLNDPTIDETSKKLALAAYLAAKTEAYNKAGFFYLMAAWCFEDKNETEDAKKSRKKAVLYLEKYLSNNIDFNAAVVLIDCLRQLGSFDEARESIESLLQYGIKGELIEDILRYEIKLSDICDSKPHRVSEVIS